MNPFMALAAIAILTLSAIIITYRPTIGLILIFMPAAIEWHIPVLPTVASLFGLSLTVSDGLVAVLLLSMTGRWAQRPSRAYIRSSTTAGVLFIMSLLAALIGGALAYGLGAAVNEARPWIYVLAVGAWCIYLLKDDKGAQRLQQALIIVGTTISTIWITNTLLYGFGGATSQVGIRDVAGDAVAVGRATTAGQTMLLAAAMLMTYHIYRLQKKPRHLLLACIFGILVILAQHRSVWVASVVMIVSYIYLAYKTKALMLLALAGASLFGTLVLQADLGTPVASTLSDSAQDATTFEGRLYDWKYTLGELTDAGFSRIILGWEFGRGYERVREDGLVINYIPHNWYVGAVLRFGLAGLVAGLAWILLATISAAKKSSQTITWPVLFGILAYAFSYNLQWYLAPLLFMVAYYRPVRLKTAHESSYNFRWNERDKSSHPVIKTLKDVTVGAHAYCEEGTPQTTDVCGCNPSRHNTQLGISAWSKPTALRQSNRDNRERFRCHPGT